MKGKNTLNEPPFRYGGLLHDYDKDWERWIGNSKRTPYKKCSCCGGNGGNTISTDGKVLRRRYPYVGVFKITKGKDKGNFQFRVLCRECAYAYGKGVIEMDGETYQNPSEFNEEEYKKGLNDGNKTD